MPIALHTRLFALAALAALAFGAPAPAAKPDADHKEGGHAADSEKPALYVKDGANYRLASADELKRAGGHDDHGGGGLSFTGIHRWDLGLYTLVVFGILMFVLSKYAWPNIAAGLEKRETSIRGALDEARKDRTEAAELLARARKDIDETAGKVRAMLDDARKDAEALKAAKLEEGEKEAAATRERANREAAAKKEADLKDVQKQAVELAVLIATKALRRQVSIENQHKLLDESIAELSGAGVRNA